MPLMRDALVHRDAAAYLRLMNASGRSSEQLLRNIRAPGGDDRLARGLQRAAELLDGVGAWRVHGGGFAGCVQALMPCDAFPAYKKGDGGALRPRLLPGAAHHRRKIKKQARFRSEAGFAVCII